MVKSLILGFILLLAACLDNAHACMGPHRRTFPACEISAPRDDERTTIVYVNSGKALSSVTLGSDGIVTEVVDIEIGVADKPHYIVLSSGKPVVWRFTGRIDALSRVVMLGSQYNGATRSGVVGVPTDRIVFAKPDMEKLKNFTQTSCDSFYSACEASAYFDIPKAARMQVAGNEPSKRYRVDQFIELLKGGVIRIPEDGWVEAEARGRWQTGADGWTTMSGLALGRYEPYGGTGYVETSQNYDRGLIKIDATSVVSPETVRDYAILPAAAGISQLLANGSLVGPDDARFKAAYDKWNEHISRPYRSKLDPNFMFSYKINYLTTRPMTLPAGLSRIALLVGEGVEAPDINRNYYDACLFFADARDIQASPRKSGDPRCDTPLGSMVLSEPERSILSATYSLERLWKAAQSDNGKCRGIAIASDAYFVGIAASEGAAWRPPGQNAVRRHVDVIVKRPGRVALYLEMWGGRTIWHIFPSENTQITNVILSDLASRNWFEVQGLPPSFPVQTIPWTPIESGCVSFHPRRNANLGGPAAIALDQGLQILTGRGLDTLLRNANDGSWPPVVSDQNVPRVTLAIE